TYLSKMKTEIKKVMNASAKDEAENALKDTYSLLDKMVGKKIIPRNRAANKKSRLTKHVNDLT
ncbi:30S ribosomal protein S20, partial [bacterium]|nr:30S ribosomal protein S20 [bacterium]